MPQLMLVPLLPAPGLLTEATFPSKAYKYVRTSLMPVLVRLTHNPLNNPRFVPLLASWSEEQYIDLEEYTLFKEDWWSNNS